MRERLSRVELGLCMYCVLCLRACFLVVRLWSFVCVSD